VISFPIIGFFFVWKVGKGRQEIISQHIVLGCRDGITFLYDMIRAFHEIGFYNLSQVGNPLNTNIWH
jgi:hypothetical protein